MLALRVLRDLLLLPGNVAGLVPWLIARSWSSATFDAGAARIGGGVALAGAAGMLAWGVRDFARSGRGTPAPWDAPRELVASGPYRFVRNPMYVAVLCALGGEVLLYENWAVAIYAACVALVFHSSVVFYEEPHLRGVFGESYRRYCAAVPRWIPRRPR